MISEADHINLDSRTKKLRVEELILLSEQWINNHGKY